MVLVALCAIGLFFQLGDTQNFAMLMDTPPPTGNAYTNFWKPTDARIHHQKHGLQSPLLSHTGQPPWHASHKHPHVSEQQATLSTLRSISFSGLVNIPSTYQQKSATPNNSGSRTSPSGRVTPYFQTQPPLKSCLKHREPHYPFQTKRMESKVRWCTTMPQAFLPAPSNPWRGGLPASAHSPWISTHQSQHINARARSTML